MKIVLDYIWLNSNITNNINFITKIIDADIKKFNGSASYFGNTPRLLNQRDDDIKIPKIEIDCELLKEKTESGFLTLKPIKLYKNPLRQDSYYVLCETYDNNVPHNTNSRNSLNEYINLNVIKSNILFNLNLILHNQGDVIYSYNPETIKNDYNYKFNSKYIFGESLINELIDSIININLPIDNYENRYETFNGKWNISSSKEYNPIDVSDDIVIIKHIINRLTKKHNINVTYDITKFKMINSEKDMIEDPYLITKKLLKNSINN